MIKAIGQINDFIFILLTVLYAYQVFYVGYALFKYLRSRRTQPAEEGSVQEHRYAAVICARNEENVIGEIIASLKKQNYPKDKLDVYVVADNCMDGTAETARSSGAIVYERFSEDKVGKGYALDYFFAKLRAGQGNGEYDAFLVFDADNIVHPDFVREINRTFAEGYDVVTSYRNSKNFGKNWITAAYSIWFLREARFLNYPRMLLKTNCAISGTGFLVSSRVIEENNGWPFYLLTEDIEFTISCAMKGMRIGYCDKAVVYDEQPESFAQSWRQRMRWSKGFYQVNLRYAGRLVKNCFCSKKRFTAYDMLMSIMPCMLLSILAFGVNGFFVIASFAMPRYMAVRMFETAIGYLCGGIINMYLLLFLCGLLTVIVEWRRIEASPRKKLQYVPLFPLFLMTYIPISLAALVSRVEWKPIKHSSLHAKA